MVNSPEFNFSFQNHNLGIYSAMLNKEEFNEKKIEYLLSKDDFLKSLNDDYKNFYASNQTTSNLYFVDRDFLRVNKNNPDKNKEIRSEIMKKYMETIFKYDIEDEELKDYENMLFVPIRIGRQQNFTSDFGISNKHGKPYYAVPFIFLPIYLKHIYITCKEKDSFLKSMIFNNNTIEENERFKDNIIIYLKEVYKLFPQLSCDSKPVMYTKSLEEENQYLKMQIKKLKDENLILKTDIKSIIGINK